MALKYLTITATAASAQYGLDNARGVTIKNDGTADVHFRLFKANEEPAAATTAYAKLTSGDSPLTFFDAGGWSALTIITPSSTAGVRVYYV